MPDSQDSQIESTKPAGKRRQAIEDGRSDIAAGRFLTFKAIDDWIEQISAAHEVSLVKSTLI